MIRFLLDMGLARSTAEFLRSQGHDVVHLRDQGLERLSDEGIVAKAQREQRTIVTHDLDFGRIVALSGSSVPSIITLRLTSMVPARVNSALRTVLTAAPEPLHHGALVTVTDKGIRIRDLPIDSKSGNA